MIAAARPDTVTAIIITTMSTMRITFIVAMTMVTATIIPTSIRTPTPAPNR